MKCKRDGCENETKNNDFVYCSKGCAPYGHLANEEDFPSGRRMGASSRGGSGTGSSHSSGHGNKSERPTSSSGEIPSTGRPVTHAELTTPGPTQPSSAPDSETGTSETNQWPESESTSAAEDDVRPTALKPSSIVLPEATPMSLSLIDDSVRQLHELMTSVTQNRMRSAGSRSVEQACLCAKNINNLIRLKLDILKTVDQAASRKGKTQ